jgi:HEAT repeat protein
MRHLGLAMFDGKWRTAQDIAIRQRDGAIDEGESNWFGKVRLWRGWLDSRREDRVQEAQAQFAGIADPQAAPALVKLLDGEDEPWAFDILLGALGRLDDALTVRTLVAYSLEFEHADKRWANAVRDDCLDYLMSSGRPVSVIPYVEALKSKDNVVVNRAGEALERIGDVAAISPLIDALVTTHKYQVAPQGPGMTTSFSPDGTGGGFSFGGNGPKIETREEENPSVLRALKKLSGGQNFDYDKVAWRRWYVDLLMRQHTNARRDE